MWRGRFNGIATWLFAGGGVGVRVRRRRSGRGGFRRRLGRRRGELKVGRIPGISLSTDTGEGRFVNIRGIDANLNGATYGGVVLLNTFAAGTAASGSGRAVEFDTIPTGAIDGIVVYKTLSPDREAEGLGGQIELTPRSAKNLSRPFFEGELGWGYENLHGHTGPFTASFATGARFGFNNGKLVVEGHGDDAPTGSGWITNPTPFSLVITASRKDDRRGVDDIEPSYANDGATICALMSPAIRNAPTRTTSTRTSAVTPPRRTRAAM